MAVPDNRPSRLCHAPTATPGVARHSLEADPTVASTFCSLLLNVARWGQPSLTICSAVAAMAAAEGMSAFSSSGLKGIGTAGAPMRLTGTRSTS